MQHASYGYVLENGAVVLEGTAAELANRDLVSSRYLGGKVPGQAGDADTTAQSAP